jgi:hypothetical protein
VPVTEQCPKRARARIPRHEVYANARMPSERGLPAVVDPVYDNRTRAFSALPRERGGIAIEPPATARQGLNRDRTDPPSGRGRDARLRNARKLRVRVIDIRQVPSSG